MPVERTARGNALARGVCDIAIGRIIPSEASVLTFSRPVAREEWAFLVPDHVREVYASLDLLRRQRALRIAVYRAPEWMARLRVLLPNAKVIAVDSIREFVAAPAGRFDAMYTGFDRASAVSLQYPQFAAVLPEPRLGSVPIAVMVPRGEQDLLDLVNATVEVAEAEGLLVQKLAYWIRGEGTRAETEPRWSVGRNILGWWKD